MNIGDRLELKVSDADKKPVWISYNENIAKVDQNGTVTVFRAGKTTIQVRSGFQTKNCTVKVVNSSIKLNKKTAAIYHGGTSINTLQLKATVKGTTKDVHMFLKDGIDEKMSMLDDDINALHDLYLKKGENNE